MTPDEVLEPAPYNEAPLSPAEWVAVSVAALLILLAAMFVAGGLVW